MLPIVTSRTNEVKKALGELFEEINKVPWWSFSTPYYTGASETEHIGTSES